MPTSMPHRAFIAAALLLRLRCAAAWPAAVTDYRALLQTSSKNATLWAATAARLRAWMQATDPDYPLYHLAAPEGWVNDPNGVTYDAGRGLYHRFYQYDKTYSDACMHGNAVDCAAWSFGGDPLLNARAWGHTVSADLATWTDAPGIDPDSEVDGCAVYSGNCVVDPATSAPVCVYSGCRTAPCDTAVCAYGDASWTTWRKAACVTDAPSAASQTSHDAAIARDGESWLLLSGGCTYDGGNAPPADDDPDPAPCLGNAQLWRSPDLRNWTYAHPLGPGGPGGYWELPYLLPFDADGRALPNDRLRDANRTALLFGLGNAYYVGAYAALPAARFVPDGAAPDAPSGAWPAPRESDASAYYSFNAHATDDRGGGGGARRLVFGWVEGAPSAAVAAGVVPYWQGAHSLARLVTLAPAGGAAPPGADGEALLQHPAPEIAALRVAGSRATVAGARVAAGERRRLDDTVAGDSLELNASFAWDAARPPPTRVGLALRLGAAANATGAAACEVSFAPANRTLGAGAFDGWPARALPQPGGAASVELRIFLDRSIVEVYSAGAALTARCSIAPVEAARAAVGVAVFAEGAAANFSLAAWRLGSMYPAA